MSRSLAGALLGLLFAAGVLLAVLWSPPVRRLRLSDRLAPYLTDAPRPSRLLPEPTAAASSLGSAGRLLEPLLADGARAVERLLGGSRSVHRRLAAMGSTQTVEDFRIEQVIWGAVGVVAAVLVGLGLSVATGVVSVVALLLFAVVGLLGGVLGRDWWLSAQVRRREELMLAELPVVAELLALAVTAGEAPAAALERVCRICHGELSRELGTALAEARAGATLPVALQSLAERTTLEPLARFLDGLIIALERGTPLADVLRAQAADVREARKRALLATGGRREIAMMVPVVFLILPVTVLFALYPGLVNITLLTR
jgi:tight adherence protein C